MEPIGLIKHFEAMGSRLKFRPLVRWPRFRGGLIENGFALGIGRDAGGEYFDLAVGLETPDFRVLQVARPERHLLL